MTVWCMRSGCRSQLERHVHHHPPTHPRTPRRRRPKAEGPRRHRHRVVKKRSPRDNDEPLSKAPSVMASDRPQTGLRPASDTPWPRE